MKLTLCWNSGEAAVADVQQSVPFHDALHTERVPGGRHGRFLPVVRHTTGDEHPVPVRPLCRLRGHAECVQSGPFVQSAVPRRIRWRVWCCRSRRHHSAGCLQDSSQHSGTGCHNGDGFLFGTIAAPRPGCLSIGVNWMDQWLLLFHLICFFN